MSTQIVPKIKGHLSLKDKMYPPVTESWKGSNSSLQKESFVQKDTWLWKTFVYGI